MGVDLAREAAPLGNARRGGRGLGVGALGGHRKVGEWWTARESVHSAWTAKGSRGGGRGVRGSRGVGGGGLRNRGHGDRMGLGEGSAARDRRSWIEGGVEGIGGEGSRVKSRGSWPSAARDRRRGSRRGRRPPRGAEGSNEPVPSVGVGGRWAKGSTAAVGIELAGESTPSGGAEGSRPVAGVGVGVGVDGEGSRVEGVRGVPMRITEVEGRRGFI